MPERECFILEGRLWYPFIITPVLDKKTQQPKGYETGIITSPDFDSTAVRELMKRTGVNKWGSDMDRWPNDPPVHYAMRRAENVKGFKGPDGQVLPEFAGCRLFTVHSQFAPDIADAGLQTLIDPKRVYSGVWARVAVTGAYVWTYAGKTGIGLNLGPVQIFKDGPALGTKMTAASIFKAAPAASPPVPAASGSNPLDD